MRDERKRCSVGCRLAAALQFFSGLFYPRGFGVAHSRTTPVTRKIGLTCMVSAVAWCGFCLAQGLNQQCGFFQCTHIFISSSDSTTTEAFYHIV